MMYDGIFNSDNEKKISESNRNFVNFIFILLIYMSIILPSGSILGVNVKFILLLSFLGILLIKKSFILTELILNVFPILLLLLTFTIYSFIVYKFDSSFIFSQFKDILVFFIIFYLIIDYAKYEIEYKQLIHVIINSVLILSVIKVLILIYSFTTGMPVSLILKMISDFFGASIMGFDIDDILISRINFASDSILPICIFYLTRKTISEKISFKNIIVLLLIVFSSFLTMSRYQWMASLIAICLATIPNIKNIKGLLSTFLIVLMGFYALTLRSVQDMIQARFDSKTNDTSDIERIVQKEYIYDAISNAPFFGNGMGYYIPEFIRSYSNKYSYELQIPALIMQFGYIGFFILIILIIFPLLKSFIGLKLSSIICFSILICMWLTGAMFNPIIFSSSSGVILALLYGMINNEKFSRGNNNLFSEIKS